MHITGTHIAYYFICARKLWLFHHGLQCESESDPVRHGRHVHETSYQDKPKEWDIDQTIVLDWIDHKKGIVHEVKKSNKMDEAHRRQLQFYLYYLEQNKGLHVADETTFETWPDQPEKRGYIGELNYPLLKQTERVVLSRAMRTEFREVILPGVERVLQLAVPPGTVEWKVCKRCSYVELCYG